MATAVHTKTRKATGRKRSSLAARRSNIPNRAIRAGSTDKEPSITARRNSSTTAVSLPITHIAAGMQLPISKALKKRFGVGEIPVDSKLLQSVETIFEFLQIGLDQNWIDPTDVSKMINDFACASSDQSRACFSLINKCITAIDRQKCAYSAPVNDALKNYDFQPGNSGGWEISFGVGAGEFNDPFCTSPTPKLVASECGLCVLVRDLNQLEESLKLDIAQLIYFCSQLSHHATTIEMFLDDGSRWMLLGDIADLDQDAEDELLSLALDESAFYECLQKHMGEDFMENLFCSLEDVAEFYLSYREAKALHKNLKTLSKKNVANYLRRLSKRESTPEWLITAANLLYKHTRWEFNMDEVLDVDGHVPFSYSRPFGFNFPSEQRIFEFLHEASMNGEESSSLSLGLNENTASILANLELGETLLLFVDEMLERH